MSDPRFARLHTDPRFVRPKAAKNKIVVDERFKQLFDDQDALSAKGKRARKVDKYGRPLEKEATANELKRYYRIASPQAEAMKKGEQGKDGEEAEGSEEEEEHEDEDEDKDEDKDEGASATRSFLDLARGEVLLESSDEEGQGSDDEDEAAVSEAESDSSSAVGSVSLGPLRRRRQPSRSPSIDLSETEHPLFPDEDDEASGLGESDDEPDVDPTRRVAVVNMDWDHLRAADLYRVLASSLSATAASVQTAPHPKPKASGSSTKFDANGDEVGPYKPSAKLTIAPGRLLHLRIYPSQFGKERMEREAIEGPPADVLRAKGAESSDDDEEDGVLRLGRKNKGKAKERRRRRGEESDEEITERDLVNEQLQDGEDDYDTEALRKYQLERLRYYYAIATFDTVSAAAHVVKEINGTEFERTANIFDLQFVPDATSFADDPVHDEATEASIAAEGNSYQGIDFSTDALRHSKVKLTWDADDPHRKNKLQTYLAAALDKSKAKGVTKGRPAVDEADIQQYLASSSDEEEQTAEEEEQDDFFEAEAGEHGEGEGKGKKEKKRERLRSLLGLEGGAADEQSWDGGAKSSKGREEGMQITFAPALSERSAKQLDLVKDERPETAIETYKRKEKERRERKKLERKARREGTELPVEGEEGPEFGGEDTGPGGFDDDFFADDGRDPFAAYDEDAVSSGDEIGVNAKKGKKDKLSKKEKRAQREAEEKAQEQEQAQLALLVGSDDEDDVLGGGGEGGRHFDMRAILKSEKNKGKKVKGKGKKAAAKKEVAEPVKDDFKVDLTDDRFKSLHEDYDFAIDPSNPRFQKSRNMDALLAEGRKRRAKANTARAPVSAADVVARKRAAAAGEGDSLSKLVEAVKRKAGETGGRGKRAKTE
ncbi:hypothetical protein JCM1841_005539 [Sporobolomyces salmonicolor]